VYSGNLDDLFCTAQQYVFKTVMTVFVFVSHCAERVFQNDLKVRQNAPYRDNVVRVRRPRVAYQAGVSASVVFITGYFNRFVKGTVPVCAIYRRGF
jgi:hypothetical protein